MSNIKYITDVDGITYDRRKQMYILDRNYFDATLNTTLDDIFGDEKETEAELYSLSRSFDNYIFGRLCYPEDYEKKKYLVITSKRLVTILRDAMVSCLEAFITTGRRQMIKETGINFEESKLINNFYEMLRSHKYDEETMQILERDNLFSYKDRLDHVYVDESLIGVGY